MKRRWKWIGGGGLALIVGMMFLLPTPRSQILVKSHSGWPVSIAPMSGISATASGLRTEPQMLGFQTPISMAQLYIQYRIVIKDAHGHVTDDEYAPPLKKDAWLNGVGFGAEDADAACTGCTTVVGANRLLGLFEGGVNITGESDGTTPASGPMTFNVTNPMIVPGTASFALPSAGGTCVDQGNGTCSGTGFTGTSSTINYATGAISLALATNSAGRAITGTYKQFENGATCTAAQLAVAGQGCWFIGLMDGAAIPTLTANTDTMGSHVNTWTEVALNSNANGGVTNTSRPIWTGTGTPSTGSDTNAASQAVYTSGSTAWSSPTTGIVGIFLTDNNGSSSTTAGTLDGEQVLTAVQPIGAGYQINVTASLSVNPG